MEKLVNSQVFRSGQTARSWNAGTHEVKVQGDPPSHVVFRFDLSSKGGGVTEIKLEVGTKDFPALLAAMVSADRTAAMLQMANTLANEVQRQPECDEATAKRARRSVLDAAKEAVMHAPKGPKHAENLVRDKVREWVHELNDDDGSEPNE